MQETPPLTSREQELIAIVSGGFPERKFHAATGNQRVTLTVAIPVILFLVEGRYRFELSREAIALAADLDALAAFIEQELRAKLNAAEGSGRD